MTIVPKMKGPQAHEYHPASCFFRIREFPNPREKDLVLVNAFVRGPHPSVLLPIAIRERPRLSTESVNVLVGGLPEDVITKLLRHAGVSLLQSLL